MNRKHYVNVRDDVSALAALRAKHGLSKAWVASQLGVSRQAVHAWETGRYMPRTDHFFAWCRLFGHLHTP